jgi:hypothetical protein
MLREYRLDEDQVAALPVRRLRYLLAGLTDASAFRRALAKDAQKVSNDRAIELLGG